MQYFTRGSVSTLLRAHGFEPVEMATQPKAFSVEYYLSRIGGYSGPLGARARARRPAVGVADRMWAPDFRDRMLVIARHES